MIIISIQLKMTIRIPYLPFHNMQIGTSIWRRRSIFPRCVVLGVYLIIPINNNIIMIIIMYTYID